VVLESCLLQDSPWVKERSRERGGRLRGVKYGGQLMKWTETKKPIGNRSLVSNQHLMMQTNWGKNAKVLPMT